MVGRPTLYTRELSDRILDLVATGRSLRSVCREDWAPAESCVRRWVVEDRDGIYARYAHARDLCVLSWAEETIEIADDGSNDFMERRKADGSVEIALDREHIQRSVARIGARQWMAARLLPKVFGDKSTIDLNARVDLTQMTDAELAAIAAGKSQA